MALFMCRHCSCILKILIHSTVILILWYRHCCHPILQMRKLRGKKLVQETEVRWWQNLDAALSSLLALTLKGFTGVLRKIV